MDYERSETLTLSRAELYEKVWNIPTIKLAKDFGLSDVALGKICKKYSIPKPPLGYWAKLAHGKPVARPPLPTIDNKQLEVIEIRKKPSGPTIERAKPTESINKVAITVPDRLSSPHALVKFTTDALKNQTPDDTGILRLRTSGCLDVTVGRQSIGRAMRLMDALIKALELQGATVTVFERGRARLTCVMILDETLEIELREVLARKEKQFSATEMRERSKSSWLRGRKEYELCPSGNFVLSIQNYCGDGVRKVWSDGKKQRLEKCLGSLVAGLRVAAEGVKAVRLERERWERERQERELRQWEEQERRRKEEEKIEHLEKLLANWNQSQKIRQFLADAERATIENQYRTIANLTDWISWARNYADSIDPIHITFRSASNPENNNDS